MRLDELSPEHRAVVELLLEKGVSHAEIAETLRIPEERVRDVAREAAQKLQSGGAGGQTGERESARPEGMGPIHLMFWIYVVLIASGLIAFSVVGLAHN